MKSYLFAAIFAVCSFASTSVASPHASLWMIYNDSDQPVFVECKTSNKDPDHSADFKTEQITPHGSTQHKAVVDGDRTSWSCTASTGNTPFNEANRQLISFSVSKTEIVNLHVKVIGNQFVVVRH
jgi:hypothetical protein